MSTSEPFLISIIIPVLHEKKIINTLIDHLHHVDSSAPYEIIVVDGSPHQDTIAEIRDTSVIKIGCKQGRGRQMNAGAALAKGDILVFLHADTFLSQNAFSRIKEVLEQEKIAGGAFTLTINSKKVLPKIIAALTTVRSQLTRIPYGDQVIFLRKKYFEQLGGYPDIPLMEDLELMLRMKKAKGKICILPDRVITSPRRWENQGALYTTLLNILILTLYRCGVPAHKLTKWHRYPKD